MHEQSESPLDTAVTIMQEIYAGTPRPHHREHFAAAVQQVAEVVEVIRAKRHRNPRNHYRPFLLRTEGRLRYQPRYPA